MSLTLTPPEIFSAFPYSPPYSIQADLMHHLYKCIEHKKVSIVESPTGTVSSPPFAYEYQLTRQTMAGQDPKSLMRKSNLVGR